MADRLRERDLTSPSWIMAAVGWAVFVAADDLTVVSTMLRPIVSDLGLPLPDGLDDAAWVVNAYLIAFIAVMPIAGRASDVIGRRATFLAAYGVFLAGTILIPLSSSLGPFLVGRVLTAVGGGAMVPVAMAVVSDVHAEPKRARALGTLGAIETLGWVWGPLYGALLVRFLDWRWQFWLNIPLALVGVLLVWFALADHTARKHVSIDWVGAAAVSVALVTLNLALLGNAEIQSVTGLDELRGGSGFDYRVMFVPAVIAAVVAVRRQRRAATPLMARGLFRGHDVWHALVVNLVVGAALVIAMVDVPLFINAVEIDLERSAVASGWVLAALTAAMAITSYVGGRMAERRSYRLPVIVGMVAVVIAFLAMSQVWEPQTSKLTLASHLAVLGAGVGLVVAPTSAAVVDRADPADRGAAASLVMVVRLVGLSVGLSALTAWGLHRFNVLRGRIELPPITDPDFTDAVDIAQAQLTADAITETFLAAALVTVIGVVVGVLMGRSTPERAEPPPPTSSPTRGAAMQLSSDSPPSPRTTRLMAIALGVLVAALLAAFVLIIVLFQRLDRTEDDLARVEAGSALFAGQVSAFQEQLVALEPQVSSGIDDAIAGLDWFATSSLEFSVEIDEEVSIDTEVVIDRDIVVPINETVTISETIETTIEVSSPLGDIPLDVRVPVDVDVPIDIDANIPINETVPVNATVPVELDVPITIDVADTELAALASSLADGLRQLREGLGGLTG